MSKKHPCPNCSSVNVVIHSPSCDEFRLVCRNCSHEGATFYTGGQVMRQGWQDWHDAQEVKS